MDPPTTAPPPSSAVTTDEPTNSPAKLRLMCSHGGHIVPRPHDKCLCYVGGDTRIVVVDRHVTLVELTNRLVKTLSNSPASNININYNLKYQLPSEDLDSLISVTTDEDLENMIDEYDRLNNLTSSTGRLRLFLFPFPVKPESVTSIGSLLESSLKSEDWFLNALNGTTSSGFSDTSSVNCLLGLEDDVAVREKKSLVNSAAVNNFKSCLVNPTAQDVQSVPDSPMLETTSSFGSASSSPPVRGVGDEQLKIEEQFAAQVGIKHTEDVNCVAAPVSLAVTSVVNKVVEMENLSPNGLNRVVTEDERLDNVQIHLQQQQQQKGSGFDVQIAHLQQQQQQQPQYQQKGSGFDMISPDSVSSDGSVTNPLSRRKPTVIYQDPSGFNDQNPRIQIQPVQQVDPQHTQLNAQPQPQAQPQFIHTAVPPPQYLHHQHHPSGAVPMAAYYQMYPSQSHIRAPHAPLDQHNFVYYMPARQPPQGYNLPPLQTDPAASAPPSSQVPPPSGLFIAPRAVQPATKTDPPAGMYRPTATSGVLPPQLVQVPSSQHPIQPQFVGYSHIQQPSQPVSSTGSGGNYVYEFADPAQQGRQHIYYAPQPLPPQSAAQYQTMTSTLPVESQADNNMKQQQVRTSSQP
ncbi:uncharacterized protein LOC143577449 [Bidens hawaiensis]|uniref:uncharacterized protein LOC143577449 n=1 Tax=Bidens hawaiensis TaxID=980011 RepID=UPI00404B34FC